MARQGTVLLAENTLTSIPPYNDQSLPLPLFILDLNGEEKRAIEMGFVSVGLKRRFPEHRSQGPIVPGPGFGALGVMAGTLALALVSASIARRYARHHYFFIALSDDSYKRSLIDLSTAL